MVPTSKAVGLMRHIFRLLTAIVFWSAGASTFNPLLHHPSRRLQLQHSIQNGENPTSQPVIVSFQDIGEDWNEILPFSEASHRSAKISIPSNEGDTAYDASKFQQRLGATVIACRELGKSSIWVEVPINRCSLIEIGQMHDLGFTFHHAIGDKAMLNLWLKGDTESKVPEFATHMLGVGAVVVNSMDEILCVRELRKNYRPWKTPTGHSELGEHIDEAVEREVLEETGIRAKFHSILTFRHTHGLAHGRSDLFFVCRLDLIEDLDENGVSSIPVPQAQVCEIESVEWRPLSEYRAMINDPEQGHPMMQHAIELFDAGRRIEKRMLESVIPGRGSNAVYSPSIVNDSSDDNIASE